MIWKGMPPSIKISPFDITVVIKADLKDDDGKACWGLWSAKHQTIELEINQPTHWFAADTLLHEILHGLYWLSNLKPGHSEERLVRGLAMGLVGVLRDNPALVTWMITEKPEN